VKEAGEFAGAHVLSMVRVHYPLIDFTRFTKGYPKEVGVQEAGELRGQLSELAATIIGDINLCGTPMPPSQGTSTMSAPGSSSRPPGTAARPANPRPGNLHIRSIRSLRSRPARPLRLRLDQQRQRHSHRWAVNMSQAQLEHRPSSSWLPIAIEQTIV
jgi:hypothetical protein